MNVVAEAALMIKPTEIPKYGSYLRKLSNDEIEKLLASVLQELRRRDFEHMKGDYIQRHALRKASA